MYNIKLVSNLLNDITKKSLDMEYRSITFAKQKLSSSDVDFIKDICNWIISTEGDVILDRRFCFLSTEVKNVLKNKKIIWN